MGNSQRKHKHAQQTYPDLQQVNVGLQPPPQTYQVQQTYEVPQAYQVQQYYEIPPSKVEQYRSFFDKYGISSYYHTDLSSLEQFDIIIVADDSGSMSTEDPETGKSRWIELKEVLNVVIELGGILDSNGLDLIFLNRGTRRNVTNINQVQDMFQNPPQFRTPLSQKVREALSFVSNRPVLLLIATDGEPYTVDDKNDSKYDSVTLFRQVLEFERNANQVFVGILKCSSNDQDTGYLDVMDKELHHLDVLDDYISERNQILQRQGRNFNYSPGDHVARLLLGPVYDKYDKIDERFAE